MGPPDCDLSHKNPATLIVGAARKAWVALREGRLQLSPSAWLRDLARHWREEAPRARAAAPHRTDRKRLDDSYSRWLRAHPEHATPGSELADLTILVLVDDPAHVDQIIRSAQSQSFDRWELWLMYRSPDSIIDSTAPPHGDGDRRVREWTLEAGSNDAWMPPGHSPYIVLLDTTTILAPGALARVAAAAHHAGADWIFTDDDLLDASGARSDPNLKGDFSPELALVDDYATRLAVASRSAIERCGGLRRESGNAQIYDLLLRIAEQNGRVHHLAEVCAHRRNTVSAVLSDDHRRRRRTNRHTSVGTGGNGNRAPHVAHALQHAARQMAELVAPYFENHDRHSDSRLPSICYVSASKASRRLSIPTALPS